MKEFIDKLIERLIEKSFYMQTNRNRQEKFIHTKTATEIVKQLAEEYKPKTQADKIRLMSDKELAELFAKLAWNSEVQTTPLKYLDWLQSEAE